MDSGKQAIASAIKNEALRIGFTDCGFSKAGVLKEDADRLRKWLNRGFHARMGYMACHFGKRPDPIRLVEGAKSVISVLYNYYTDKLQEDTEAPVISKYAYGRDYHFVMKDKLGVLFDFIRKKYGPVSGRIFVDSAPVLERAWARQAGLGWIGKNSNLISRQHGSFLFIGEIICDLEMAINAIPENDFCGTCKLCVEACPTNAILPGRTLDARKCIAYQTIENKEEIDEDIRPKLTNHLFGCDICQDVCPWNRRIEVHHEPAFKPSAELIKMRKNEWFDLDRDRYDRLFKNSAVERAGYEKLVGTLRVLRGK